MLKFKSRSEFGLLNTLQRYNAAKLSLDNRSAQVAMVKESLERDMELLCVTGVEDKLQARIL